MKFRVFKVFSNFKYTRKALEYWNTEYLEYCSKTDPASLYLSSFYMLLSERGKKLRLLP